MLLAATAAPAAAADDPLLAEATGLMGIAMFLKSGAPGLVLGAVSGDRTIVTGYGETAKGNGQEPDGRSLFRLNSISKVFAGEVLATQVELGRVRLTDTLQKYAGGVTVPGPADRPITLLDLATHSAALPRELGQSPDGVSPRAWPTRAVRWAWLPKVDLPWKPGTVAAYSNVGFDLLADALETASGVPYSDLLRTSVTEPLGMRDTTLVPNAAQCERLMLGTGLGGAFPCGDSRATGGSGGLYSTADDMVLWLRHNLEGKGALQIAHAVYRQRQAMPAAIGLDEGGDMSGLGLGWVYIAPTGVEPALLAKSGGGLGFLTYAAFAPGRGVGVFFVMNRVDFDAFKSVADVAHRIIATLATR